MPLFFQSLHSCRELFIYCGIRSRASSCDQVVVVMLCMDQCSLWHILKGTCDSFARHLTHSTIHTSCARKATKTKLFKDSSLTTRVVWLPLPCSYLLPLSTGKSLFHKCLPYRVHWRLGIGAVVITWGKVPMWHDPLTGLQLCICYWNRIVESSCVVCAASHTAKVL